MPATVASATPMANTMAWISLMLTPSASVMSRLKAPARIFMPSRVLEISRYRPIASTMQTPDMNSR